MYYLPWLAFFSLLTFRFWLLRTAVHVRYFSLSYFCFSFNVGIREGRFPLAGLGSGIHSLFHFHFIFLISSALVSILVLSLFLL